jgi:hypothetical protein
MATKLTSITRTEMIAAVEKNIKTYDRRWSEAPRNSFASHGVSYRLNTARRLLSFLENGGTPSTNQVVGYFGKGARFANV